MLASKFVEQNQSSAGTRSIYLLLVCDIHTVITLVTKLKTTHVFLQV